MEVQAKLLETTKATEVVVTVVVTIGGRLDAVSAVDLREELDHAFADGANRIIVDLSAAEFIDSAGLAALANGMRQARHKGGDLRLVYPMSDNARRVFSLTRFDQVFITGETVEEVKQTW